MKPLILLSNDDGYEAKGLGCLIDMLRPLADLVVCAPEGPRSGFSCAFSATIPLLLTLRRREEGLEVWSCNGTPVDCVKMAFAELLTRRPDMVIGGINHGDNGSVNSRYSGTMGVTLEGCMKYVPSVAYSLCDHDPDADFEPLRPYIQEFTTRILREGLPKGLCLNINFPVPAAPVAPEAPAAPAAPEAPAPPFKGVKVCRMAHGTWYNEVTRCHHPRGYDYYWMVGHFQNDEPEADDTDNWALTHGYVAITPTQLDVTHYAMLQKMKDSWEK